MEYHSTPVLLPGNSHGRRSLVDCSSWGHKESDTTSLSLFTFMHWRRKWQPTPVFLPGESQGWGAWWAAVYGVAQSWTRLKRLSSSSKDPLWRRKCHPTPVLLPGESHGCRSLVGYSPWGRKESDTTERLHFKCEEGVATIQWDVPGSQLPSDALMAKGPL